MKTIQEERDNWLPVAVKSDVTLYLEYMEHGPIRLTLEDIPEVDHEIFESYKGGY